jgi:hypothetical protein
VNAIRVGSWRSTNRRGCQGIRGWRAASPFADNPDVAKEEQNENFDASKLACIAGPIVELRTINPHVVLVIDGTGPDGRAGRWVFEGLPPNAFQYPGLKDYKERLKPGTIITISGWPAKDPQARAFSGREITFADGTTMLVGISTPGEADRWQCADPCPYTYPTVQ